MRVPRPPIGWGLPCGHLRLVRLSAGRRRSQVVRQRSAKPPSGGSNPPGASHPRPGGYMSIRPSHGLAVGSLLAFLPVATSHAQKVTAAITGRVVTSADVAPVAGA